MHRLKLAALVILASWAAEAGSCAPGEEIDISDRRKWSTDDPLNPAPAKAFLHPTTPCLFLRSFTGLPMTWHSSPGI